MIKPILLVEDNSEDLELALRALSKTPLANDVIVARDGEEALDYLLREGAFAGRAVGNPTVVFLDMKLPKINGLQVLERVKSDPSLQSIPVVMLTSSKMDSDLASSYKLGANAFVVKPLDFSEFNAAIRDLGMFWGVLNQPPLGSFKVRF